MAWPAATQPPPPSPWPPASGAPDPEPWQPTARDRDPSPWPPAAGGAESLPRPAGDDPGAGPLPSAPGPGVPSPRGGGRRAARRSRGRTMPPAPEPAGSLSAPEAPAAPGPGRRRAPAPGSGSGSGRRARGGTTTVEPPAGPPAGPAAGPGRRARGTTTAEPPAGNWRRIVPQALVVAFLAGGTTAFVAADKSVRLTVDGVPRNLHTFSDDIGELLAAEGLGIGPHDLVAPAPGEPLDDGEEIVVRYGRPLHLTLDGRRREVWTTARTVEGALRQFGIRAEGAYLSAPRTAPVPRTGLALSVRTERSVTFMADGRERTIRTNAATVQEALDQAGITLHGQDTTSVPPASFPRDGQTVTVLRITGTREVREERIPYETEKAEDATLFAGTEVVERAGRPGARRVTYGLRTVNGVRQKPRRIAEEIVREPVTQLVKVGTKPLPASVAGADGLDWGALAHCESGGRPGATDASGTYGGLYQFDVRTWQALGGSGRPQDAPGTEQTYRAKKLYVQRGASPWPHCGRRLYR
ncbi:ubiquitin-like domain-containing protein [Streptomyces sp. NPDC048337]|uniref:ubiquitin-like domain-containing protein n=1 Tax=Streptomyces sp. NPDC048337 TaxID=3365535 RepID=UPI003712A960